jgi:hypothetical protein
MNTVQIAEAYRDAYDIVRDCRVESTRCKPVWDKLERICEYIKTRRDEAYQAAYGEVLA